ncbi:MAG: hypothetical protein O2924_04520 [Chloroflexi bacterium]|nr:hypothetical protein [Chloroflexota bacterium]
MCRAGDKLFLQRIGISHRAERPASNHVGACGREKRPDDPTRQHGDGQDAHLGVASREATPRDEDANGHTVLDDRLQVEPVAFASYGPRQQDTLADRGRAPDVGRRDYLVGRQPSRIADDLTLRAECEEKCWAERDGDGERNGRVAGDQVRGFIQDVLDVAVDFPIEQGDQREHDAQREQREQQDARTRVDECQLTTRSREHSSGSRSAKESRAQGMSRR